MIRKPIILAVPDPGNYIVADPNPGSYSIADPTDPRSYTAADPMDPDPGSYNVEDQKDPDPHCFTEINLTRLILHVFKNVSTLSELQFHPFK